MAEGRNLFGQEPFARRGEAATAAATAVSAALPVGMVTAYWGTTAPTGWLVCDGAAIPAQFGALIALVGANTPNLKGRVIVGINAAEAEFDTLGETGGSKDAIAVTHNHTQNAHNHTQNGHGHGVTDPGHRHNADGDPGARWMVTYPDPTGNRAESAGDAQSMAITDIDTATTGVTVDNFTATNIGETAANQAAGSSGTAANLSPYMALSYIIKAT